MMMTMMKMAMMLMNLMMMVVKMNDYDDDVVEDDGDRQCIDTTDLYLVSRKSQKG